MSSSHTSLTHSEMTRAFKVHFSISFLDCHLHNMLIWPRGDMGGTVLSSLGGTLSQTLASQLQRSYWELCNFCPEKRWLGSWRSYVVMALVLGLLQQQCLEASSFYCLLCLSSWNLWKNTDSENFRPIAASLLSFACLLCSKFHLVYNMNHFSRSL